MPTINIITQRVSTGVSISTDITSESSDSIKSTTINGITFIDEDISKQIDISKISFITSFLYVQHSLEVFINGVKLSSGFDFEENSSLNGFSLIEVNANFQKWINASTCILVRYIKSS